MPPTNITIGGPTGPTGKTVKAHRVYTRVEWGDAWELMEEVHCLSATWSASPTLPEATLYYRYGVGRSPQEADGSLLYVYARFILPTLVWVKIEFDTFDLEDINGTPIVKTWYGIAGSIIDHPDGDQVKTTDDPPEPKPSGYQQFHCVGLEWLLDFEYLSSAIWERSGITKTVNSAPAFGTNRTASKVFGEWMFTTEDPTDWTTRSIVEALLNRGPGPLTWKVRASALTFLPDWDKPAFEAQGYSIGSLLKRVIARERALGFYFEVVDEEVELVPFTFTSTDIDVGDGDILANARQFNLTLSGDATGGLMLITDAFARYHKAKVIGARATSVFTVSVDSSTLEIGWSGASETDYISGASSLSGYPPATEIDARRLFKTRHREQAKFEPVFRRFKIDVGGYNTLGTYQNEIAMPAKDDVASPEYTFLGDKTFLSYLPLLEGVDYASGSPVYPPLNSRIFEEPKSFWSHGGKWFEGPFIHWYGRVAQSESFEFSATVRPLSIGMGFDLIVQLQRKDVIASAISALKTEDAPEWDLYDWDYRDALFTIAVELDHYCEVEVTATGTPESDIERVKLIQAGDTYRLDRAAVGTVVGVDSFNELVTLDGGDYLQDDRDVLTEIANRALAWYGKDRKAARWSTSWINGTLSVGDLIVDLTDAVDTLTIEAPITGIMIEVPIAVGALEIPIPKMSYQTNFAELDVF